MTSCAFHPSGTLLATTSGDWDKSVRLWDPVTADLVRRIEPHADWVTGCAFSPDGATLVTWSGQWTIRAWDPATGKERRRLGRAARRTALPHPERGYSVSPDRSLVVVTGGGWDATARVLDNRTGEVVKVLAGHRAWVHGCCFSPDGALVATASGDGSACVWDPVEGRLLRRLEGHESWVTGCAFSPDGTLLATTSADHTARLWSMTAR